MKMLENLQQLLQSQNQFGPVLQRDDYLELPKLEFQICWAESLDRPGNYYFWIYEDDYPVEVCDSIEEVVSTIQDFLDDLIDRFGEIE